MTKFKCINWDVCCICLCGNVFVLDKYELESFLVYSVTDQTPLHDTVTCFTEWYNRKGLVNYSLHSWIAAGCFLDTFFRWIAKPRDKVIGGWSTAYSRVSIIQTYRDTLSIKHTHFSRVVSNLTLGVSFFLSPYTLHLCTCLIVYGPLTIPYLCIIQTRQQPKQTRSSDNSNWPYICCAWILARCYVSVYYTTGVKLLIEITRWNNETYQNRNK